MHSSLRLSFNIKNYICTAKWSKKSCRETTRTWIRSKVRTWSKKLWGNRAAKYGSIDRSCSIAIEVIAMALMALLMESQWNLNPTAPCKGWSYLTTLLEIIFPRTSTLKSPISQLPTMIISKPLTKCKSISQYNLTTQFIRNINVITQVNFNVNQSMFKWWPL